MEQKLTGGRRMKSSKSLYSKYFQEYKLNDDTLKRLQEELLTIFIDCISKIYLTKLLKYLKEQLITKNIILKINQLKILLF